MASGWEPSPALADALGRYLAIWEGRLPIEQLGAVLSPEYVGYIGRRPRTRPELAADIGRYLAANPGVQFTVEQRFGNGEFVATRLTASRADESGRTLRAAGLNISHWVEARLVGEWAVWEPFGPIDEVASTARGGTP